jgi:hypothetical protein
MVKPLETPPGGGNPDRVQSPAAIARASLLALGLTLLLTALAGFQRIWSQISAANAPLELVLPFTRPLAASAVETAFLLGVPVGLTAAAFRSLGASGGAPFRQGLRAFLRPAFPVALALSAVSVVAGFAIDPGTSRPGELARDLIERARLGCLDANPPREIEVPLVKVRWRCGPLAPRVSGKAPIGRSAEFSASELRLNDDLTRLELTDLALEAGSAPKLRLWTQRATIAGLRPWGRPQSAPALARGVVLAGCALAAALLAVMVVLTLGVRSRVEPWLTALSVAIALWATLSALDRRSPALSTYAVLPIAAGVSACAAALVGRVIARVARRRVQC